MEITFDKNTLLTRVTISGSRSQEFRAIVDTGSDRTSIPRKLCKDVGLAYSGDEGTLTPDGIMPRHLFDAIVKVRDRVFRVPIAGLDTDNIFVLGLDILSNYRIFVDWISNPKNARTEY